MTAMQRMPQSRLYHSGSDCFSRILGIISVKTLRLTRQAELPVEHMVLLNGIADELRRPFTACVEELGRGRESDLDWWVSELACRNTYTNPLFLECCYLVLVRRLLEHNEVPEKIIVDSRALYTVLTAALRRSFPAVRIELQQSSRDALKDVVKPLVNYVQTGREFVKQFRAARKTRRQTKLPGGAVTLIDTFVFPSSFPQGQYNDRYYDGFAGALTPEEEQLVFYVPTFMDVQDYEAVFLAMRSAPQQFLAKEDVLTVSDYLYALAYPLRMLFKRPGTARLLGEDITPLVRQIWYKYLGQYSSMDALLKARSALRLKERGVQVRLVVDWFENQIIDKGLTAGVHRWLPGVPVVGYQVGIDHKLYLCYYPTSQEQHSGVLPDKIAVTGSFFCESVREFCPELDVTTAPAFRYRHVWEDREFQPDAQWFTVLLALPITLNDGNDILHLAASVLQRNLPGNIRFQVKQHPTWTEEKIRENFGAPWPAEFSFVRGGFRECVEQADVVVGNNSSALLETVVMGIPVIIAGSRSALTQNPIPDRFPHELWRVCFAPDELLDALVFYRTRTPDEQQRQEQLGRSLRKEYFEPVTTAAARQFLQLPATPL